MTMTAPRFTHHIYTLAAAITALLALVSCDDGVTDVTDTRAGDVTLTVSVPLADTSRAVADDLNEFRVNTLHLYFFRADGHDDATSTYVWDVTADEPFDVQRSLRLTLPDDALADGGLFGPDSDICYVYAVANVPAAGLTALTVDGLRATLLSSAFDRTEPQPDFAMDCLTTLTLDRATRTVTGDIVLRRSAAKLTLAIDLPASIDVEQTYVSPVDGTSYTVTLTYTPRPADMHVWIANGVRRSRIDAAPAPVTDEDALYSNDIYAADGVGSAFAYDDTQPKYKYVQEIPFYSYPSSWDAHSPNGNCHLTLEIPWTFTDPGGDTHSIVTYYRLSVQPDKCTLVRNTHYDMRVTIGRLGGTMPQEPVDMLFDWNYNMQWNTQTLPTDIKEIRYLLLNNNDFSTRDDAYLFRLDNNSRISIPYNTSHPVEIESVNISWRDYLNNRDRSVDLSPTGTYRYSSVEAYTPATHFAGISIDPATSTLLIRRDLVHIFWNTSRNRPEIKAGEPAINSYTITVRLRHTDATADMTSSYATVMVIQTPAINITTQYTSSENYRFVNKNNTSSRNGQGYVSSNSSSSTLWLGSIHGSTYAKNKNTYILTISKFADGDDYIIADPRTRTVDNLNPSGSATATASWSVTDNATRKRLTNYYPADDSDTKKRFIAPQIRVASQWGVTYQLTRDGAERRCASYQEDGRPAGRWRLPTVAEIEYICRLSNNKYIPYLFGEAGNTANYWCASGGVDVDNDANNPSVKVSGQNLSNRAVRCVYDEWYWGTDTLTAKSTFTWGDKPRSTSGN